jgi:NAD(P)-dependent dehydrogenase (short-subunit alcohol dehydrogenase family)
VLGDADGSARRLDGRTAIVTGASRGIGAAVAERLAAEGADVVVVARTAEHHPVLPGSLQETAARCARHGARVEAVVADLAEADSRAAIVPRALERFGKVDILVNNAAAALYGSLLTFPLKRRRISFEVNVEAPVDLAQAVIPGMLERGEGWIVNVSSVTAKNVAGPPYRGGSFTGAIGVYGASKAALNRVTHGFAVELEGTGIRVNTIEPRAGVHTEGADALVGDTLTPAITESMEAMVEGVLALCDCPAARIGGTFVSLDLIDELGLEVRGLDGRRIEGRTPGAP